MRHFPYSERPVLERGVVLPIALIMLVIISFAGLLAARHSASFDQFSNNMRTNQVARVSAEDALRRCERIARYSVDDTTTIIPPSEVAAIDAAKLRIVAAEITADDEAAIRQGVWDLRSSWVPGAANLIVVTPSYTGSDAQSNAQIRNSPTCIIQAMVNDRFLSTARGLSNDAMVDADTGLLTEGSEVWLQSILTPFVPNF